VPVSRRTLEIKFLQYLDCRKVGLLDAPDHRSAIPFLNLGFEQRFQITQVRLLLCTASSARLENWSAKVVR
jgi:hypothetical protein